MKYYESKLQCFLFFASDYDPDPIASLRKRRISADSADRGSHRETMHSLMSSHVPPITSPLAKSEGSHSVKKKGRGDSVMEKHKHKKKRKHHHCKRKHKRHNQIIKSHQADSEDDSLKIKLDGSFNNTTTYSIRSPMYQPKFWPDECIWYMVLRRIHYLTKSQ